MLRGCIREKMEIFEGRAAQIALISLRSTDEARGINSILCECFGFVVMYVAATGCAAICFELYCPIVGEVFSSLPS